MATRPAKPAFSLPFLRRRAEEEAARLPPLMTAARRAAQTIRSGEHSKRRAGTGEKFWQFRDYQPGDRPQDIDWRQSAKGDRVFIRQKEWQTAQTALFWCAGGPGMDYKSKAGLPNKREAALTLSLGLALLLTQGGEQAGLLEGGMNPGRSEQALETLGQNLLHDAGRSLPQAGREIPRHATLFLTGDFLDPPEKIEAAFGALAARSEPALVIQTLDPAELALPFAGRVIFEDPAGTERHHIAQAASVRDEYRRRIEAHLATVEQICHRLQWRWLLHVSGNPVAATLAEAWQIVAPQRTTGAA